MALWGVEVAVGHERAGFPNLALSQTPGPHRIPRRSQDILYGVFADSDSDGDGGRRKRGKETTTDYTAPVGFVKSAVINDPSQPPEASSSGRAGLGAGTTAGLGMGFRSAGVQQASCPTLSSCADLRALGQIYFSRGCHGQCVTLL